MVSDTSVIGRADAQAVVVVFTDFQCPYCARFALGPVSEFKASYVDDGRAAIVVKHFPLEQIHPWAFSASVAVECAAQQHRLGEFHDHLFQRQAGLADLASNRFASAATDMGLDLTAFSECLISPGAAEQVRSDVQDGSQVNVSATPTVMVGRRVEDGRVRLLRRVARPTAEALAEAVEDILATDSKAKPMSLLLKAAVAGGMLVAVAVAVALLRKKDT